MRLRTLFIFILLAGSIFPLYAFEGNLFQDSVKKVTIKITVTEKTPSLNFDSLLDAKAAELERTSRVSGRSSRVSRNELATNSENVTQSGNETNYQKRTSGSNSKITTETTTSISKATPHDHPDEVDNTQVTDENEETQAPNDKASRTYLWVGIMLMVVGMVLGILFGKTAFLISAAGMVFVIIGYVI